MVMVVATAVLAVVLYALPVFVLQAMRARKGRPLWAVALDVPLSLAVDLFVILLVARLFPIDVTVIVVRVGWCAALGVVLVRRWRKAGSGSAMERLGLGWPHELSRRAFATAAFAGTLMAVINTGYSLRCHGFDRAWHIPLSTSIRGQRLPFSNVYEPGKDLAYHFTGDVLGATLQTLSGGRIHSSLALGLAHDVAIFFAVVTVALLLWDFGFRRLGPAALASIAPFLGGPITLYLGGEWKERGHNFINLFYVGFRPHVPVAVLMMAGFVGALLTRLRRLDEPPPVRDTAIPLVACTAILAITDEASVGVLGLTLGFTWILVPSILAPKRLYGIGVLAALLVAVVGTNVLHHGAMFGGIGQAVSWVPGRAPGFYYPPKPWNDPKGFATLVDDLIAFVLLAIVGLLLILQRPRREHLGSAFFSA
ncbi:MAG: hypothetical protein KC731_07785, partial [Myxococcales bacterium]|nr:hypothetical protein [Myxococcales bacterium]